MCGGAYAASNFFFNFTKNDTMKKTTIVFLLMLTVSYAQAQITFEHHYPNATFTNKKDFGIVKLDSLMHKYYYIDYPISLITLYNLDHSIYKTITIPVSYNTTLSNFIIYYISTSLFDCDDSNLEYLLGYNNNSITDTSYVRVYREDGNLLFSADSAGLATSVGGATLIKPGIYPTEQGTKMILNKRDKSWNIYSLCGTLPSMISEVNFNDTKNPFPNPTSNSITIPYVLPEGVTYANLKIFDMEGKEIRSFKVDGNFNNIILNTSEFVSGNYVYYLVTEKGISGTKKFIKL